MNRILDRSHPESRCLNGQHSDQLLELHIGLTVFVRPNLRLSGTTSKDFKLQVRKNSTLDKEMHLEGSMLKYLEKVFRWLSILEN